VRQIARYKSGHSLSYIDEGNKDGFPILIQHGLIATIDDLYLFNRLLQLGTRLICIARPGYGESSPYELNSFGEWAEVAWAVIDELQLAQFDVLGMSSGAPYSYALGYKFPDRVRNIFIFSGIPALYDEQVLAHWPYPIQRNADIGEMKKLARDLFFSNLSEEDLKKKDIHDSIRNDCFGVGLDLQLRGKAWGFQLSDVKAPVSMQHSRMDPGVPSITAELTARLLPKCELEIKESDVHFSGEALDDFIQTMMAEHYQH
jgi:pimeloyl-ACP methyl ester carboxylesterase